MMGGLFDASSGQYTLTDPSSNAAWGLRRHWLAAAAFAVVVRAVVDAS